MAGSGSLEVARGKGFVCGLVQGARGSRAMRPVPVRRAGQGHQSAVVGQTAGKNRRGDREVTASGRWKVPR